MGRKKGDASPGIWQAWLGEAVHYCLCIGAQPLTALGRAEYIYCFEIYYVHRFDSVMNRGIMLSF